MKEIIELMRDYAERHEFFNGVTLEIEDDESGAIHPYLDLDTDIFSFTSVNELIENLKN